MPRNSAVRSLGHAQQLDGWEWPSRVGCGLRPSMIAMQRSYRCPRPGAQLATRSRLPGFTVIRTSSGARCCGGVPKLVETAD